tara:strand:+ start:159 stop:653 length:495 start_codon:yes stop_codon:yes gene_type:complete
MNYQKYIIAALLMFIIFAFSLNNAYSRTVTIPVISVHPMEVAESRLVKGTMCTPIVTGYNNGRRGTDFGQIIGGILGSMVGNSESERRIGTAVGVIIGGRIGERHNTAPGLTYRNHCGETYSNQVQSIIEGYKVTYEYQGRLETVILNYDPGSYITLETTTRIR